MRQAEPKPRNTSGDKPKIDLASAETVLVMYWKPAYVQVGSKGQSITRWTYGLDPIKNKQLALCRLLDLVERHKGRFTVALLKAGMNGPVQRVWLANGLEITPEEFEKRRTKDAKANKPTSLLRVWVLPHEDLLLRMKSVGLVSPDARGITWYSSDVDTSDDGKYLKGYDVAMFSLVNMLKQVRHQWAEARIFNNNERSGKPLAIINWQGATSFKESWFKDSIKNSKHYKPWQLGIFD